MAIRREKRSWKRDKEEAQRRQVASLSSYKLVYVLGEFNYTFHLPNAFLETALVVAWRRHSFAFEDNKKNTAKPSPSAFLPRTFFQCSLPRFILHFVVSLFHRTFALSLLFLLCFSFVFVSWLFFRFLPFSLYHRVHRLFPSVCRRRKVSLGGRFSLLSETSLWIIQFASG